MKLFNLIPIVFLLAATPFFDLMNKEASSTWLNLAIAPLELAVPTEENQVKSAVTELELAPLHLDELVLL